MTDIRKNLEDAKELLIYAENVALSPEGPAVYEATLEKDLQVIEELCNRASYKSLAEAFFECKMGEDPQQTRIKQYQKKD